jgi:hypothetical protein
MKAFAETTQLKSLKKLHLTYNKLEPKGFELMQDSKNLQRLETLDIDIKTPND